MRYDSRRQSLFEINSIINECSDTIYNLLNLKYMQPKFMGTPEYIKTCEEIYTLVKHLEEACVGISNLKFTYINDLNVEAQLEIIIAKINNMIRDTKNNLCSLVSSLSNDKKKMFTDLFSEDIDELFILQTKQINSANEILMRETFQDCE